MRSKSFALGAVLLMCMTAFACVSIVSDDSDAASSGTAGSISHPLSGTATLYTSSYYTGSQTYMYGLVVPGTVITVIDNVSHGAFSFESTKEPEPFKRLETLVFRKPPAVSFSR